MAIVVDPGLLDYLARHSGHCTFVLKETPDSAVAAQGLQAARRAVGAVPHPEEPEDGLPSWMSAVETTGDGAKFTVDIADAEVYEGLLERVIQAVVDALGASGVETGLLGYETTDNVPSTDLPMDTAPPTARSEATGPASAGPPSVSRSPIRIRSCGSAPTLLATSCHTIRRP